MKTDIIYFTMELKSFFREKYRERTLSRECHGFFVYIPLCVSGTFLLCSATGEGYKQGVIEVLVSKIVELACYH